MDDLSQLAQRIPPILRKLGVSRNYKGYWYLFIAVVLILEDDTRLLCVKRDLYPAVAAYFGQDVRCIERDIRTVINRSWELNPEYLSEIAGYQLRYLPTCIEFLDSISGYILHTSDHES